MTSEKNIIDSHVHLDLIVRHHPYRIQWLKENGCRVVSWSYFEEVDSVAQLQGCLKSKAECIRQQSAAGLVCHYLAGIHPRSIPQDLRPEQIGSLLKSHLEDPLCRGIGEIGLETGDAREQEVFIAQLELGRSQLRRGKITGVHTPRSNKRSVTETTLEILAPFADLSSSLVVDHCTVETIGAVLDAGFWAGVTLSPAKTSMAEMKRIVSICPDRIDRVMCNTDSGSAFFEDLVHLCGRRDLPEAIRVKLSYRNAARFFALP
ncbi:MAG: TatD family hydrolase [Desulfobacterales bacterium]|nr:MAG: TatD family hydrolase [Desulfobacterales bacterium]